jgi:pyridoxamine 5'-phosphate oxidase
MGGVSVDPREQRRTYRASHLSESELAPSWLDQFRAWFADASAAVAEGRLAEANAMVFATATPDGVPSARTVLLKGYDARGFVLFTNLGSTKALEAAANPRASLVFPWFTLERQVVVAGTVTPVDRAESEAYFRSRPHGSQLGAWASPQSRVITGREMLERRRDALGARWPATVPAPPFWGGLRVAPVSVEFWQGRPDRLHDRMRWRMVPAAGQPGAAGPEWIVERLAP